MAIIYSYPKNTDILETDVIVGTSTRLINGKRKNITKNFEIGSISEFYNENSSIAIAGQSNFFFQKNIAPGRKAGSISFAAGGGGNTPFNSITSLRVSKFATSGNDIIDYLNTLVGQAIIITQTDDLNNFGIYKFISITQVISEPNFYDVVLESVNANSNILEDKFYGIAVYPGFVNPNIDPGQNVTKTSQLINDGSDGTSTYVETEELGEVAFSNDYNDLDNLPTIPEAVTKTSDLTNDGSDGVNPFITLEDIPPIDISSKLDKDFSTFADKSIPLDTDLLPLYDGANKKLSWSNIKSNLKTYFDAIYQTALGFTPENVANKATNLTSPDNTKYPTTQAVVNGLATKQNTLTNPVTGTGANGQVAFWNGTNSQTGDNGLFWDNTNKRLGVGTTTPENILSISATLPVNVQENVFLIKNLGITRTVINNLGIQSWSLNNGSSEVGRIVYSTPSGRPGIIFFNSTSTGRSDIRQITGGGISIATTTLGTIPSDQFYFHPTGNFSINAATDAGFRLDVNGTTRLNGNTSIGGSTAGARLDVRAQGALSTDIAFRVRNSADTANLIQVNGLGGVEINSTTQGFLPPRMTTTQKNAIVSPASGLVIYDTTLNKLCVRGASAWETITSI